MESFEVKGNWWLPEASDRKIRGTLSFDPTSTMGRLTLKGQMFSNIDFDPLNPREIAIVLGECDGVAYTLQQCYAIVTHRIYSIAKTVIDTVYIFKGEHFDNVEDIVFENVTVSYPSLDGWIDHAKLKSSVNRTDSDSSIARQLGRRISSLAELAFHVANVPFEPLDFHSEDNLGSKFDYKLTRRLPLRDEDPAKWKRRARLIISPRRVGPFFGSNEYCGLAELVLFRLPNFLTLATGRINDPQSIKGKVSRADVSQSVTIYRSTRAPETGFFMQPLFVLDDVKDNLSKYLSNWNIMYYKLWEVYDLYFRWNFDLYHGRLYHTTTSFLNMARALEAYHRRLYDKPYICEATYKRKKKKVIKTIRATFCKSFSDKLIQDLSYGNQYSFARRLKSILREVLGGLEGLHEELFGDLEIFVRTVVDTRNKLTHVSEEPSQYAIPDNDLKSLHEYVTKMRMLLRMCFMVEMEFPIDLVRRLMTENRKHENLM